MAGHTNETFVGWVPEDGNRGSWSIIRSSLITMIACTWTVLHPRIHVDRKLRRLHKACQLSKQILAPELETIEALQELLQARKAKACCAKTTGRQMSLTQAFYIGMMGIRYRTENSGGYRILWPLQYAFLLEKGLVSWPSEESWGLSEHVIQDRSKADGLLKLFTLVQVIWFTVNCIVRSSNSMYLAPLESMTLAYVVQVLLTYVCWWKKPKDIATATFVELPNMDAADRNTFNSLAMELTYDVPDPASCRLSNSIAWYIIPRDCGDADYQAVIERAKSLYVDGNVASRKGEKLAGSDDQIHSGPPSESEYLETRTNDLKRTIPIEDIPLCSRAVKHDEPSKAQTKIITEWDDSLYYTRWWPLVCLVASSFGAVHMISWNGHFATITEKWLWRSSCVGSIAFALIAMQFKRVEFRWCGLRTVVQIGCPLLYVVCRIVMVAEVVAAFRAMPESTYETVAIVNYWLHF